jgi:hypothetical protein
MKTVCGLENGSRFLSIVADFYSGMETTVPLFADSLAPGWARRTSSGFMKAFTPGRNELFRVGGRERFLSAAAFRGGRHGGLRFRERKGMVCFQV